MKYMKQPVALLFLMFLMSTLLLACSSGDNGAAATGNGSNTAAVSPSASSASEADWTYTDSVGHTVQIPAHPERIVYSGETYGDLVALGVKAVGYPLSMGEGKMFEDQLGGVEDVEFPINLEKTLELQPDLIIYAGTDEADYEALSKIAPTVIFDTFAPLEERMPEIGKILGKSDEAAAWLDRYKTAEAAMWQQLKDAGLQEGETASVFTYYPGDRLYVMAGTGLPQMLYEENGFTPPPAVQKVIDEGMGFQQISLEVLEEFAGDRIFILTPVDQEAQVSTETMKQSPIWQSLPAVKNGKVYTMDIMKSSSDAATRNWLLDEIPNILGQTGK
ncbi:ABC transporter substrate-binding protein [Paenibacillus tengchongensis]|uniref:ABC transporter substrate-binding protein n=1 Tax=Paenibacillus tengchongensis TaxID=2608684 RepID=UPI00124C1C57|nr:ABC transporter substrate-binding protein [Paenibacillus tengchongensis]